MRIKSGQVMTNRQQWGEPLPFLKRGGVWGKSRGKGRGGKRNRGRQSETQNRLGKEKGKRRTERSMTGSKEKATRLIGTDDFETGR